MKIVRTLGLAALAATALLAVAGASSAFAGNTTLCKTAATPFCAAGNKYAAKTGIEAKAEGTISIWNSIATINCGESQLNAESKAEAGNPLGLAVSGWTLGKCGTNAKMNNCTVSSTEVSKEGSVSWSSGSNGALTLAGGKGVGWHLQCPLGIEIDCTFTLDPKATIEGGSPAHIAIPESALSTSGSICPKTATLKAAKYSVSSPSPLYVASAEVPGTPTQLCKLPSSPCSEANTYPSGTSIVTSATDFKIAGPIYDFTCKEASLTFKTLSATGGPLPVSLTSASLGGCKSGAGSCSVIASILTPKSPTGIEWKSGEGGVLKNLALSWEFVCGIGTETTFEMDQSWEAAFEAGVAEVTPSIRYVKAPNMLFCKGACQAESALTATFKTSSPTPLYVTHF